MMLGPILFPLVVLMFHQAMAWDIWSRAIGKFSRRAGERQCLFVDIWE